ncbi:MAG TPA: DUF1236 domain-containing protein [Xanthobacteraceae bacterium]|nr:DUF1236 domain-containing protein [Xanthobacteraceae bacterium]
MNYRRNMLLASIASLALVAGAGLAQAQEKEKAPQAAPPHAAAQPMSKAPAAAEQPKAGAPNQRAEEMNRPKATENPNAMGAKPAQKAGENERMKPAQKAEENERMKPAQKAEENEHMKPAQKAEENEHMGKPGNTAAEGSKGEMQKSSMSAKSSAAANVKLSSEQRTRIKSVVLAGRGGPRVAHVNFDVRVGTIVPRGGVEYVPVPETLVEIEPMWRGFDYFVYGEELVIIDPDTLAIIAVIPV